MSISRAVGVRINAVSLRAACPLCRLSAEACRVGAASVSARVIRGWPRPESGEGRLGFVLPKF